MSQRLMAELLTLYEIDRPDFYRDGGSLSSHF